MVSFCRLQITPKLFKNLLPVYKAISFQSVIDKGSRTKPWVVLVDAGGFPVPYVVKLFDTREIIERGSVINEVLGSILASEFDLPVPAPALIEMDEVFKKSIPNKARQILTTKDQRVKFGCKLLDGYYQFAPNSATIYHLKDIIDIDTVFGFDNVIRNADRGNKKPNIIVRKDSACLIDHELAFEIDDTTFDKFFTWQWEQKFYHFHIFYHSLKTSTPSSKKEYFHSVEEYLKLLNINKLKPYLQQLANYGYPVTKHLLVLDYLTKLKLNSSNFVRLMTGVINIK